MAEQTTKAEAQAAEQAAERKKTISRIIRRRKAGLGYPAIAKELNDEGVPTLGGGKTWHPPVVRGICIRELGSAQASMDAAGTRPPAKGQKPAKSQAASRRQARPDPKKRSG